MIEQISDRAHSLKTIILGALGTTTAGGWLIASMKAATVFFQFIAAFCAAVAGCLTLYYMLKSRRRHNVRKPRISQKIF